MPSSLGAASGWDPESACAFGDVIGGDLRSQGFNMTLGDGVNRAREPRNGRTFEYAGEDPPSGNAIMPPGKGATVWQEHIWFPTSPIKALQAKLPNTKIDFDSGNDLQSAAKLAKGSDLVIVFAYQWLSEEMDVPSLSLPDNQDPLIEQVAAANPHTIVVLETGSAVAMSIRYSQGPLQTTHR